MVAKRIGQGSTLNATPHLAPSDPNWQNYEVSQPTTLSNEVIPKTFPPLNFDNKVQQNDLNDRFDETGLLKRIPKPFKKKASALLQIFDERPNEITWDSSGNIYLDEQSLPGANIFELFPYLYRKRSPKSLVGLTDVVNKLHSMGVAHLINRSMPSGKKVNEKSERSQKNELPDNWWYLG